MLNLIAQLQVSTYDFHESLVCFIRYATRGPFDGSIQKKNILLVCLLSAQPGLEFNLVTRLHLFPEPVSVFVCP
jgi:hypothetical protein